ncbi:MAG: hypothetical protein J6R85_03835, partial [Lentisphaeria bacterium]|nr:hypothetical protein [Lentisphaeria bacterium]
SRFYITFARLLQGEGAFEDHPWVKLQHKTDWNAPVQEKPLLHRPMPRISAAGDPADVVFFALPERWEDAANDGERCRWLLDRACAGENADGTAALIGFLRELYRFVPEKYPENAEESAQIAAIPDGETQVLLRGKLTRIALPDHANPLRIAGDFLKTHPDAEAVASHLAEMRMERFQYRQAEAILKPFAERSRELQNRLKNLTKPGILVTPLPPFSPGTAQKIAFRSRNNAEVLVEIRRIDLEKVLTLRQELMESPDSPLPAYTLRQLPQLLTKLRTVPALNPALSTPIFHRTIPVAGAEDHYWHDGAMPLPDLRGGLYLLTLRCGDQSSDTVLTISSRTLLYFPAPKGAEYFVLNAANGAPVPHTEIRIHAFARQEQPSRQGKGRHFTMIREEKTFPSGSDGRCIVPEFPGEFEHFLVLAPAPDGGFAWLEHDRSRLSPTEEPQIRLWTALDSPVYRPGSTVRFESYLRSAGKPASHWADKKIRAVITDPRGNPVQDLTYDTSSFGSFDGTLKLASDGMTGEYQIDFRYGKDSIGNASFRVEEFQTPEYRITIRMPSPGKVQTENAVISCCYFSGTPAAGAKILWRLTRRALFCPGMRIPEETIASGQGVAGKDGSLAVSLGLSPEQIRTGGNYILTAEVQDAALRTESASSSLQIPSAEAVYQLTGTLDKGFAMEGESFTLRIRAASPDHSVIPGKGEWAIYPATLENSTLTRQKEPLKTIPFALKDDPEITFPLTIRRAGVYLAAIRFTPDHGAPQETEVPVYICDNANRTALFSGETLAVFPAQKTFAPGETAKLLIVSSQPSGTLLCRARPHRGESFTQLRLNHHHALWEIPLQKDDQPNLPLQIILNTDDRSLGIIHDLPVPYAEKKLQVSATVQPQKIQPGGTAQLKIHVTDADGNGVSGASVTVAGYDQALESVAPHAVPEIFPFFWGWRRSMYLPWQSSAGNTPVQHTQTLRSKGAVFAANADAAVESAAAPMMLPARSGMAAVPFAVRKSFLDTLLWIPRKTLDAHGNLTVPVTVPDNLTTWQIRVWALAENGSVGESAAELTAYRDFTLRPELPRFLVAGDTVEIPVLLQNDHHAPRTVTAELLRQNQSCGTQNAEIPAGGQHTFRWKISGMKPEETVFLFRAVSADGARDAVERTLSILPWGTAVRNHIPAVLTPEEDQMTLSFSVPASAASGSAAMTLQLTPSIASGILGLLPWLSLDDSDNLFSRADRLLPPLAAWDALKKTGAAWRPVPEIPGANRQTPLAYADALQKQLRNGLEEIASMQNPDGGWGWFSGGQCRSGADTTIRALEVFRKARSAGFPVEPALLQHGVNFLQRAAELRYERYQKQEDVIDNLSALMLAELAAHQIAMPGYLDAVYRSRERLSPLGLTLLARALAAAGDQRKLGIVLENLQQYLVTDPSNQTAHLRVPQTRFWHWSMRSTETNAAYLSLRKMLDPAHPELPMLAKYLTENLLGDPLHHSHRALASGAEALADYLTVSGELRQPMVLRIALDGKEIASRVFSPDAPQIFDGAIPIPAELLSPGKHTVTIR